LTLQGFDDVGRERAVHRGPGLLCAQKELIVV